MKENNIRLIPKAKEILQTRHLIKAHKLADYLGLVGHSGKIIAGQILAVLPEWTVSNQHSKRTWIRM